MFLTLISSLWVRYTLDADEVYTDTTTLSVQRWGWALEVSVAPKALTILGYLSVFFMLAGGKNGLADCLLALYTSFPQYPVETKGDVLVLKRDGDTRWSCSAQHLGYAGAYLVSRCWSLGWVLVYLAVHAVLVHPTFLTDVRTTSTAFFNPSPEIINEKTD